MDGDSHGRISHKGMADQADCVQADAFLYH